MPPDDDSLAASLRALRKRERLTQEGLAELAGLSRRTIGRIESGDAGSLSLETIRRAFTPVDARVRTFVRWNGAALDRLLDQAHADLVERVVAILRGRGWQVALEVSYSVYGERGSIDVLAGHDASRAIVVTEVKSAIGSTEETNRLLDVKVRLAPGLAEARFGWRPLTTSRMLVLPDDRTQRRIVAMHAATFDAIYPDRGRAVRRWLRQPVGRIQGLWFLSDGHDRATGRSESAPRSARDPKA